MCSPAAVARTKVRVVKHRCEICMNSRYVHRFYKMAKAITTLAGTCSGERREGSTFNMNKALMKDAEKLSLTAITEMPASTLQGLSEEKAKLLEKMNVSTVKDLAELKYANWAEAIVALAEYEEA